MEAKLSVSWGLMPRRGWGEPQEYTCGMPLMNKEVTMSSMLRVLPVQPYENMGSVLTD
jgi:hypothetical protein